MQQYSNGDPSSNGGGGIPNKQRNNQEYDESAYSTEDFDDQSRAETKGPDATESEVSHFTRSTLPTVPHTSSLIQLEPVVDVRCFVVSAYTYNNCSFQDNGMFSSLSHAHCAIRCTTLGGREGQSG